MSSVIKTLVEEATFEASGEVLTFRAMDPSHLLNTSKAVASASDSVVCEYSAKKPLKLYHDQGVLCVNVRQVVQARP